MKITSNQRGFAAAEAFLGLVVLGIIGFTGWFVYQSQQNTNKTLATTGNSSVSASKPKPKTTSTPVATSTQQYATISQWGVKFPVSGQLASTTFDDITAAYSFSYPTIQVRLTDTAVPTDQTCKGGVVAWIERTPDNIAQDTTDVVAHVGTYKYHYMYPQDCTVSESTGVMAQAKQALSQMVATQ